MKEWNCTIQLNIQIIVTIGNNTKANDGEYLVKWWSTLVVTTPVSVQGDKESNKG